MGDSGSIVSIFLWQHMGEEIARPLQAHSPPLVSPDGLARKILPPTSHTQKYSCFSCLIYKAPALEQPPKPMRGPSMTPCLKDSSCCGGTSVQGAGDPKENNTQVLTESKCRSEWGMDLGVRVLCVYRWSRYRLSDPLPRSPSSPGTAQDLGGGGVSIPPAGSGPAFCSEACPEWLMFSLHTKSSFLPHPSAAHISLSIPHLSCELQGLLPSLTCPKSTPGSAHPEPHLPLSFLHFKPRSLP